MSEQALSERLTAGGALPAAADDLPGVRAASELEAALGCPFDPETPMSFARGVRADEQESVPAQGFELLWQTACHERLVPVDEGGRLDSFEDVLGMVRALSRRDVALAVGLGSSFLAASPVWIWGDEAQRRRVAEILLGRGFGSAGVSEDAAGSDLLATRTRATPVPGGFSLDGEKWLIGNAGRASFATVLAASEPSFGLFLVDLERVGGAGVTRLAKVRTVGLRGHDLGGLAFDGVRLDASAALGRPGRGIEMVYGMLQFTRTLVGAMTLGAADTALRIALRHARGRRLYGEPALALAPVRGLLARAFADVLAAECTELAAARALDVAPRRTSLWSAVAKYVVPRLCVDAVGDCGEILSARAYLRDGVAHGAFQKVARDAAITPVFEGTQLVQLETIRAQLASALRARRPRGEQLDLAHLFAFGEPAGPWRPREQRPSLVYGGRDEIVDGLDAAAERLAGDAPALAPLARRLVAIRDAARAELSALAAAGARRTPAAYEAARRHCLVHAGACCLHTWLERRDALGGLAADPAWPELALRRVLERLGEPAEPALEAGEALVHRLCELDDDDRSFSLLPVRIAPQHREGDR